jgi:hypothetical protein
MELSAWAVVGQAARQIGIERFCHAILKSRNMF